MTSATDLQQMNPPDPEQRRGSWVMGDPVDAPDAEPASNPLGLIMLVGLFAFLYFAAGPRYFLVVVGLVIMIFLHELGHFMTARWTGMKATQFFLGMGPRIWSFKRGEVEYGVRAIPAGAFVRIIGMNNLDPVPPGDEPRAYKNQAYWKRMVVITAGSMMHFLQAIVLFTLLYSVVGVPRLPTGAWTVGEISGLTTGEVPAVAAGIEPGDTIVSIDGVPIPTWDDLRPAVEDRAGEEVTIVVGKADGTTTTSTVELVEYTDPDGTTRGFIGIGPTFDRVTYGPLAGAEQFGSMFVQTLGFIPDFLSPSTFGRLASAVFDSNSGTDPDTGEIEDRPISVVGAVRIAGNPGFDWSIPIEMLALVNVSVGLINLVPLLPLDGGHAAIATYEKLRSRKGRRHEVDVAKLLPLTYAVVALLAFLMMSTVWLDIVQPIG
ncbi:MAG: RIP metalloprotease [Acidimicrobiales bacterium]